MVAARKPPKAALTRVSRYVNVCLLYSGKNECGMPHSAESEPRKPLRGHAAERAIGAICRGRPADADRGDQ